MNCCFVRAWKLTLAGCVVFLGPFFYHSAFGQTSNGVLREVYSNIGGSAIADLTSNPSFPNNPSLETIEPLFESPTSFGDNYGQRLRALVTPPATGNYIFWIASDDQGYVYLSTD